jgi:hypothetical protein
LRGSGFRSIVAGAAQNWIAFDRFALFVLMDPEVVQIRRREGLFGFDSKTVSAP